MLEKIGLPPKPSLRGNNWVVDASHCQGCSSQFTFINRKHHCRRCGGIFCGSCTQQRMVLRGQGDSPVRICEPCKKLEEAARYEMRYGHKNRSAKGGSKHASRKDDEILNEILGHEISTEKASASSSSINSEVATLVGGGDTVRSLSLDQPIDMLTEVSATPEDLRQQALVEKQNYKTLKAEGKSEEALKAFKRGKELERQAGALELSLRKNRKRALSSNSMDDTQQIKYDLKSSSKKNNPQAQKGKASDDLSTELKDLGWSDLDLHDTEKKPATVESELSSLLREVSQKPNKEKRTVSSDKSQVTAHKKKALELKRAGNLVEAKEELKKAKILERKIEEEELLGESDESDDELSSLMRSMNADEHDDISGRYNSNIDFDLNRLIGMADDNALDGNLEVTDEDMYDPEISSALTSLGWEEDTALSEDFDDQMASSKRESYKSEIQSLKRDALNQKMAGNTAGALALLKKAKLLEAELENSDVHESGSTVAGSVVPKKGKVSESVEGTSSSTIANVNDVGLKSNPKSKLVIQKELIALKKKALTLRREGKIDESDEELRKAKVLEEQLEDMNKAPPVKQPIVSNRQSFNMHSTRDDEDEEEVTDQDLQDPAYLSFLKNLGWEDEEKAEEPETLKEKMTSQSYANNSSVAQTVVHVEAGTSRKSKSEIQRELLTLKRKALTLRRQGEAEEADEVLEKARSLEAQLNEFEQPTRREDFSENNKGTDALQNTKPFLQVDPPVISAKDSERLAKDKFDLEKPDTRNTRSEDFPENIIVAASNDSPQNTKTPLQVDRPDIRAKDSEKQTKDEKPHELHTSKATVSQPHSSSLQQEILVHKRKALAFKRDGKLAEAKEELRKAKLMEKQMEETPQTTTNSSDASTSDVSSVDKEASPSSVSKPPLSSREKFKLQQESLGHKRQALKLRREGKTAEADAEFELAKAIELRLQEMDAPGASGSSLNTGPVDDVNVEDFLDPQLLAALQSIGLGDAQPKSQGIERPEPAKLNEDIDAEREQLSERIKAEKVKAVNLKRSGKQAEALDALRRAKLYEKKLQSLT